MKTYEYFINLDERGEFDGLAEYLYDLNVIDFNDTIVTGN